MEEEFVALRPLLFSIAYRMLSSVADAEDVVQESWLRYQRALTDGVEIASPKAYLSAVVTRLSIDVLRSARVRRETYVGEWLPEPLMGEPLMAAGTPTAPGADSDSLSMAFLLVLERLSPVERAVFLLHDVFAYEFAEIAPIVERSVENCRQIAVRARRRVREQRPRFEPSRAERDRLATRLIAAMSEGYLDGLVAVLAADVTVSGDNGGVPPMWTRPIVGREKVARLLAGLGAQMRELSGVRIEQVDINGQPGACVRDGSGRLVSVFSFEIADGAVQAVRSEISRDKLRHLGPLADVPALQRELRAADRGGRMR
jgi:RNA polymerase sigma-70 factor (ECF subfamily)